MSNHIHQHIEQQEHLEDVACPTCWGWDPLVKLRQENDPPLDVLLSGAVFFDLIFTGLNRLPRPGEEIWASGMGSGPGGIVNLATATARLGLRTGLVAGFGDDAYADWMWQTLSEQERVDLSASVRFKDFHSAVTVSVAYGNDRSMISHGHALPESLSPYIAKAPPSRAALVDLCSETDWLEHFTQNHTLVFADVGFDENERWDLATLAPLKYCHAFTPNAVEAMGYTRTSSPAEAVRKLADLVPLAIVTDGKDGSYAIDSSTNEEAYCPAIMTQAIDPTGAGDTFAAACVLGTLAGWPLSQRLRFASLCSSLAVQQFGGSLAAPGWGDISDWWRTLNTKSQQGDLKAQYDCKAYNFLAQLVPQHPVQGVRRAQGTFALSSDAGNH